jgi:precorrin-6A synthase
MKTLLLIGIGTGSPEHLTIGGVEALNRADLLFLPDKGTEKADLIQAREAIIDRFVSPPPQQLRYVVPRRDPADPDYQSSVDRWHNALAGIYTDLVDQVPDGGSGAFLVWGDPGVYDSTLRILGRVNRSFNVEVVPGITAIQALTAAHGIPLNRIGEPVLITTGRQMGSIETDTVVMLDGQLAFRSADPDLDIFWGAYLGSPHQLLIAGRLGDVAEEIVAVRQAARQRHGWIMDTYLLRRRG